jgi:plastocyanin
MGKASFEHTFDKAGTYDYFCMVHPWMVGNVKVN